jgi:hypothetical protein
MRHRRIAQSLAHMASVRTQSCPYAEQYGQRSSDSSREHDRYELGRRFWIIAKDVADLGLGRVTDGRLGHAERDIGVAGNGEVEHLVLVGCGGAERSKDDGGDDWLLGCEELVGQVLVGLWTSALSPAMRRTYYQRHLCFTAVLHTEYERLFQAGSGFGQGEESLVWSLPIARVEGCENKLEAVGCAQCHRFAERCRGAQSRHSLVLCSSYMIAKGKPTSPSTLRLHQHLCS